MASIRADGHEIPLVLPLEEEGYAVLSSHLVHVRFGFIQSSIYVEEEVMSDSGRLKESVYMQKVVVDDGHVWHLRPRRYRVYGLSDKLLPTSTEILTPILDKSNGRGPLLRSLKVESLGSGCSENTIMFDVNNIKREPFEGVIELSSDSEGETPIRVWQPSSSNASLPCTMDSSIPTTFRTSLISPTSSGFSRPPLPPNHRDSLGLLNCLCKLSSVPGSRNELAQIDFHAIEYQKVQFLPTRFDGDILFELPPCRGSTCGARGMEGMDKRYDGHAWCRTMTSNIHNDQGLKFRKSHCIGHLICKNTECDYRTRALKSNETEWIGTTKHPFSVGQNPPLDSTVLCKVCRQPPICLSLCSSRIYYVLRSGDLSRACIHLGIHLHPVADGQCRESLEAITELIANEVARTPTAKTSAITLAASKEFLDTFLIHDGSAPKEMLHGDALENVMDKFKLLSSPNVRNIISSFRSNNKGGGEIDRILDMKGRAKMEYIHDSVFPGQGQDKVYLFKMLVDGPGSGVDLVRRMQPGGNLENCFVMFDHVKRVKLWTTIACHVYDSTYCKVMTIAVCDMQTEGTEGQIIFWRCLNKVMVKNGVSNPTFKGFMCDSAQANFNAIRIVYGSGDASIPMVDRERTCLFHWATSMHKHTEKLIAKEFQKQHIRLCRQYKDAISMVEADKMYLEIKAWWYSSGAASEPAIRELEDWLAFWHFRYRQWGAIMDTKLTEEELADIPTCNLAETMHNKWMQASGKRGSDLFVATCDDWVQAFMQMTNYRAYLCGGPSGKGPSKGDLKLKRAMASGDGKKIAEALSEMPGAEDICTRIPHLEGEEVFGSSKRKLDLPIGSEGDSHRPDKVNFSHPRVQIRSAIDRVQLGSTVEEFNTAIPHTQFVAETDCDTSEWHIARISHKSRKQCHAIQKYTQAKCKLLIVRQGKPTAAPTYRGQKREYKGTAVQIEDFWFCADQIARCVMGPKRSHVLTRPEIPEIWPVLAGTNLTRTEVIELEEAGFRLQSSIPMSPRRLFTSSRVFEPMLWTHPPVAHAERIPSIRNGKQVRRSPKPTENHRNQWESARNVTASITGVNFLPYPGLGAIITLLSGTEPNEKVYNITLSNFPSCTCPHYGSMNGTSIGKRGTYINCKHLYYLFRYFCKLDYEKDKFIHAPTLSLDEVKQVLVAAGIMKTCE